MIQFSIPNMECGGCAKGVTRAILHVDPAAQIDIDLATRVAAVESMGASEAELLASLAKSGFPARIRPEAGHTR